MPALNLLFFGCLLGLLFGIINAEIVVTASAGETAVLICPSSTNLAIVFWTGPPGTTTYSYPNSTKIWYNEGTRLEINGTNAALLIHNVTLEDEGVYICSATGIIRLVVTNETIDTGTVVTANAGETAVLMCPSSTNLSITFWAGPPGFTTYSSENSTDIVSDDGARLEINESNAALLIHNAILDDEGIYRCFASGVGIADVQLVVTNVPPANPVVANILTEGNLTVIHGTEDKNVTLLCSADGGKPKPNITWSRKDTNETYPSSFSVVEHNDGTFAVSSSYTFLANRSLDGVVFICSVYHPALASPLELEVQVYLNLKPQLEHIKEEIITTDGFEATFSCNVFGARPEPNVTLLFNGEKTTEGDNSITVYDNTTRTYSVTSEFSKVMDRIDNRKAISCLVHHITLETAINKTSSISVYYPPSAVVKGENASVATDSISVECLVNSGNPENYSFYKWQHTWLPSNNILRELESTSTDNNKAILTLTNLTYRDTGQYKCRVSNGVDTVDNPNFVEEQDVYIFVKDVPFVVDGRTEYLSDIDEKIDIVLEVYTNVEPITVSIERNPDTITTTAVWTILDQIPKTIGVPVYNQRIIKSGYGIPIKFEVQAEKNYGAYRIVIHNAVGSTYHHFSVSPREKVTTAVPAQQAATNNFTVIILATVVPVVLIVAVIIGIFIYCKFRQRLSKARTLDLTARYEGTNKRYTKDQKDNHQGGNLYDDINLRFEPKPDEDGYLEPQSPEPGTFKAEYIEIEEDGKKIRIKRIEGVVPPGGKDYIDMSGSMKFPSLTHSDMADDTAGSGPFPSLTIHEIEDEATDSLRGSKVDLHEGTDSARHSNEYITATTESPKCSRDALHEATDSTNQSNEYVTADTDNNKCSKEDGLGLPNSTPQSTESTEYVNTATDSSKGEREDLLNEAADRTNQSAEQSNGNKAEKSNDATVSAKDSGGNIQENTGYL